MNVQSLQIAKRNLRGLLDSAYELIYNLFHSLHCDQTILITSKETINDRNILLYLAAIESRVQQIFFTIKINRKGGGNIVYTDDTTISWRIDHRNMEKTEN